MTAKTVKSLIIWCVLAGAAATAGIPDALAQDPAPAAPATSPKMFRQDYGAWTLICAPLKTGGEMCEVQQTVVNDKKQAIATFALIRRSPGLAMRVDLPIGVYLRKNPVLQVDQGATTDGLSYVRCTPRVCISRMMVAPAFLDAMRKGSELAVTFHTDDQNTMSAKASMKGLVEAETALIARSK